MWVGLHTFYGLVIQDCLSLSCFKCWALSWSLYRYWSLHSLLASHFLTPQWLHSLSIPLKDFISLDLSSFLLLRILTYLIPILLFISSLICFTWFLDLFGSFIVPEMHRASSMRNCHYFDFLEKYFPPPPGQNPLLMTQYSSQSSETWCICFWTV